MDRKTRKAKLSRLQLPISASNKQSRDEHVPKSADENIVSITPFKKTFDKRKTEQHTVEENFKDTDRTLLCPEDTSSTTRKPTQRIKRTKLDAFLFRDANKLTTSKIELNTIRRREVGNDDLIEPTKKPKKAPTISKTNSKKMNPQKTSKSKKLIEKKQMSIKSAFWRNERMFAEIAAQHCAADEFDGDEVQLALALSKSEILNEHVDRNDKNKENDVIVVKDNNQDNGLELIHKKLEMYGFRTADRKDYKQYGAIYLHGAHNQFKQKSWKWSNKFTPLTLRNAERQDQKLKQNIEMVLKTYPLKSAYSQKTYELISAFLAKGKAKRFIFLNAENEKRNLHEYFVKDLFEVSTVQSGYLLKNFSAIQGRDLSPPSTNKKQKIIHNERNLLEAYKKLENYFISEKNNKYYPDFSPKYHSIINIDIVEIKQPTDSNIKSSDIINCTYQFQSEAAKGLYNNNSLEEKENSINELGLNSLLDNTSIVLENSLTNDVSGLNEITRKISSTQTTIGSTVLSSQRVSSPDIFADMDNELQDQNDQKKKQLEFNGSVDSTEALESNGILSFEIYNQEEIKENSSIVNDMIDLTQDDLKNNFANSPYESNKNEELANKLMEIQRFRNSECLFINDNDPSLTANTNSKSPILLNDDKVIHKINLEKDETYSSSACENSMSHHSIDYHKNIDSGVDYGFDDLCKKYLNVSGMQTSHHSQNITSLSTKSKKWRKSISFTCISTTHHSVHDSQQFSIDLTQTDNESNDRLYSSNDKMINNNDIDDNEPLLLSDDEICYSMWKENCTKSTQNSEEILTDNSIPNSIEQEQNNEINIFGEISNDTHTHDTDYDKDSWSLDNLSLASSRYSNTKSFDKKQPIDQESIVNTESQLECLKSPNKYKTPLKKSISDECSFLISPSEMNNTIVKHFRPESISKKFNFLFNEQNDQQTCSNTSTYMPDEFDEIVGLKSNNFNNKYSLVSPTHSIKLPQDFNSLLKSDINATLNKYKNKSFISNTNPVTSTIPITTDISIPLDSLDKEFQMITVDGRKYSVRYTNETKPNFIEMSDTELEKRLHDFGVKTLKRKSAIKLLEYIFNQTHPIIIDNENKQSNVQSKSNINRYFSLAENKLKLSDSSGIEILKYTKYLKAELPDEQYILPTNVTKKTIQPLVPLHIAWYNLLCSNEQLYEMILMYQPIDLQDIYLFFKSLGYRYDPKDMKGFFDRRCIIFRYDVMANNNGIASKVNDQTERKLKKSSCQGQARFIHKQKFVKHKSHEIR